MDNYPQQYAGQVLHREKGILHGKKRWFCTVDVPILDGQFFAKPFDGWTEPKIGDWVFVVFQDGNIEQPIWMAGTWLDVECKDVF